MSATGPITSTGFLEMSDYLTTTVENLYYLLPSPETRTVVLFDKEQEVQSYPPVPDVDIRLRTASPLFFPLSYIRKGKMYEITLGHSKHMPRGAVYLPVLATTLVDVRNFDIPEEIQIHPRGWKDMRLEDLNTPYREDRP